MRHRCRNPKMTQYHNYGGRGIEVCDRWYDSFAYFLEDMGKRPSLEHSLDRIDNEGNYEPSNCRWGTRSQQASNRRKPKWQHSKFFIEYNGEKRTRREWADLYGISVRKLTGRLRSGWTFEQAVGLVPRKRKKAKIVAPRRTRTYTANGRSLSVNDWCALIGITRTTFYMRLNNNDGVFDEKVVRPHSGRGRKPN